MRIKDVVDVGHILGRELRFTDDEEEEGIRVCIGAMRRHIEYVYTPTHVMAFDEAVEEADTGEWS